jgi:hypothetical protein
MFNNFQDEVNVLNIHVFRISELERVWLPISQKTVALWRIQEFMNREIPFEAWELSQVLPALQMKLFRSPERCCVFWKNMN